MEHYPDNWVVLRINLDPSGKGFYKVLAGWSGGYLDGDYWRMNSGITSVVVGDTIAFYGQSGSCYHCHKGGYRLSMASAGVYNNLKELESFEGQITLMPEDTDWSSIEWEE